MKLTDYLHECQIQPKDIPKVLLTFKAGAWMTWLLTIPICAKFQPLRRLFTLRGPKYIKDSFISRYPERYANWEQHVITGSEYFAKLRIIRWIPNSVGQKPKDFGLAVAETTVLYKCLFPIWAPLQFMLIVRLYQNRWANKLQLPSLTEFSDSYQQTSAVHVFSLNSNDDENESQEISVSDPSSKPSIDSSSVPSKPTIDSSSSPKPSIDSSAPSSKPFDSSAPSFNSLNLDANAKQLSTVKSVMNSEIENKTNFSANEWNDWNMDERNDNVYQSELALKYKNLSIYDYIRYNGYCGERFLFKIMDKYFDWREDSLDLMEYERNQEIKKRMYEIMLFSSSSMCTSLYLITKEFAQIYNIQYPDFQFQKKTISISIP